MPVTRPVVIPSASKTYDDYDFTTSEAADKFKVDPKTVIKWIRKGWLSAGRTPGGQYRLSPTEIEDFKNANRIDNRLSLLAL